MLDKYLIEILLTIAITAVGFIMTRIFKRIDDVEKDNEEIKDNYLTRFENVISNQNENKIEVIKAVNELKIEITKLQNKN